MNRVNQIFMGTKWPDDNSNIQGLGFEIAEVSIRTCTFTGMYKRKALRNVDCFNLYHCNVL